MKRCRALWRSAVLGGVLALCLLPSVSAHAADVTNLADGGGLLSPFDVTTSDGVPLHRYQLIGGGENPVDDATKFLMGGMFALARTLVGAACWLVDWVYRFPVLTKLTGPAQHVSNAYQQHVLAVVGIGGLFLAWSFTFGLIMVMRGRPGRGFGEILLTLLISAVAATSIVRPDVLLGPQGPLQQAQSAALEAAVITARSGGLDEGTVTGPCVLVTGPAQAACAQAQEDRKDGKADGKAKDKDPCDVVAGPARDECLAARRAPVAGEISGPITRTLTDVLVVQPYQLLQYGQLVDKSGSLYKTYLKGLDKDDKKKKKDDPCNLIIGPADNFCSDDAHPPKLPGKLGSIVKLLQNDGDTGKAAAEFMSEVSWDRVFGALILLIAAGIVFALVVSMALAMIGVQFGCAITAAVGCVAFAWALLPGPNRAALWKWVGYFGAATVLLFAVAVFIPLFGIGAQALLADSHGTVLVERLALLDGLAVCGLALHRRMRQSISGLGQRFALRMRYAKIGGSHMLGDQAAATGLALSSLGVDGRGVAAGSAGLMLGHGSGSSAHTKLALRRSKLAAGWQALADGGGRPGLLAEAAVEGRRGWAPVTVAGRAAQLAWVGPPRERGNSRGGTGRSSNQASVVIDGATGEILSHPDQRITPVGTRLQERLSTTLGGRVLLRAGKAGWYSTVGLPATYTRVRRRRSEFSEQVARQLQHYDQVAADFHRDTREGLRDISRPVRRGYEEVARPIRDANRMRIRMEQWQGQPRHRGGIPHEWFERYLRETDHDGHGDGDEGGRG